MIFVLRYLFIRSLIEDLLLRILVLDKPLFYENKSTKNNFKTTYKTVVLGNVV